MIKTLNNDINESEHNIKHLEILTITFPNNMDYKPLPSNGKLLLEFNGAKKDVNSISKMTDVISAVNKTLSTKTTVELRDWVNLLKMLHPKIDQNIKDFDYFRQMSEEIAHTVLGFKTDTQNLELEDWKGDKPQVLRNNVSYKVSQTSKNILDESYKKLNEKFTYNISTEFTLQRNRVEQLLIQKRITTASELNNYAHDFHLAGDVSYNNHITYVKSSITSLMNQLFGDSVRLINYLYPINNIEQADSGLIEIYNEKKPLVVDHTGTVVTYQSNINNDVLTPIKEL